VTLADLKFDQNKMDAIVKRRDSFSKFPLEDANLPKKAWPGHVSLYTIVSLLVSRFRKVFARKSADIAFEAKSLFRNDDS
jgi:hypothetical protein